MDSGLTTRKGDPLKILIVSQYFWPESFRINEVAQSLLEAGCQVEVLTGQPNYPDGVTFPGYRAFSISRQVHKGVSIQRIPLAPRGNASTIRMIANYLSFALGGALLIPWLMRGRRFDVIFVYGVSPLTQAIPAIVLGGLRRVPVVLWVQDLWPETLAATGYVRSPRLLRLAAAMMRWIYRRCDLLLVQSKAFIAPVSSMAERTPVEYLPNPGEVAFRSPASGEPALRLPAGFNVMFAGNFGKLQALDTILAAAGMLKEDADIRFVLVGSGNLSEHVRQEISRLGLTNVMLPGRFEQQQMPAILSQASVLLVTLARIPILAQTIPSKVQAYLAAGRPIIASLDGEGGRIVSEANCGISCPAEDSRALVDAILQLKAMPESSLHQYGANGRKYYDEHFEPSYLASSLKNRFVALCNSATSPQ